MDKERAQEIAGWLSSKICDAEELAADKLLDYFEAEYGEELDDLKNENAQLRRERDSAVAELVSRQPMSQTEANDFVMHMRALYDNIYAVQEATKWLKESGYGTLDGVRRSVEDALKCVYVNRVGGKGMPE